MPHYLNLSVVFQYDFIVTYLAVIFLMNWILAKFRIMRLSIVFRRVWENRSRQIYRRRSQAVQTLK